MDLISIPIPVPKHIWKYLNKCYGSTYKVSTEDALGLFVLAMLTKEIKNVRKELKELPKSSYYIFNLSYDQFSRDGCFIKENQSKMIGKAIDKFWREMLYNFLIAYSSKHPSKYKDGIKIFCEMYNITEDDISLETIYRDFYRKKNNLNSISSVDKGRIMMKKN